MRVYNHVIRPLRFRAETQPKLPTGFAEIVSDDFPLLFQIGLKSNMRWRETKQYFKDVWRETTSEIKLERRNEMAVRVGKSAPEFEGVFRGKKRVKGIEPS